MSIFFYFLQTAVNCWYIEKKGKTVTTGTGGVSPHQNIFGYQRISDHLSYKAVLVCLGSALYTKNISYCPFSSFNYIPCFLIHFVYSQNFYIVFITFLIIMLTGWDVSFKFRKHVFSYVLNDVSVWWWSVRRPKFVILDITVHRINISIK